MSRNRPRNMAASVRQRLLNRSREQGEDFQMVLGRYVMERFLYRLGRSAHRDRFVLKGAQLFLLWEGHPHRMTRDLDLLGHGASDIEDLVGMIRAICATHVEDDGLVFATGEISGARIREDQDYEGVRVKVPVRLGSAAIRLQVDIGLGDAVTPTPEEAAFPTLLDMPAPRLRTYPKETEELRAKVSRLRLQIEDLERELRPTESSRLPVRQV